MRYVRKIRLSLGLADSISKITVFRKGFGIVSSFGTVA